jgi:hypothetical protein
VYYIKRFMGYIYTYHEYSLGVGQPSGLFFLFESGFYQLFWPFLTFPLVCWSFACALIVILFCCKNNGVLGHLDDSINQFLCELILRFIFS